MAVRVEGLTDFTRHLSQREKQMLAAALGKVMGALRPPRTPSRRR